MHRFIKLGLVLLGASLLATGTAQAQILIDPFFVPVVLPQATEGNPQSALSNVVIGPFAAQRQISASATGTFTVDTQVDGDGWIVASGGMGTGEASLDYLGFNLSLGTNYFLELALDRVEGSPVLEVTLTNTSLVMALTGSTLLAPTTSGYSVFFDVRTLTGYAPEFLDGVTEIRLLTGDSQPFFIGASSLQFSPVPEPSAALLAAVGWGGLALCRRLRRRSPEAPR